VQTTKPHPIPVRGTRRGLIALALALGAACREEPTAERARAHPGPAPAPPSLNLAPGEVDEPIPGAIANGAIQAQLETVAAGSGLTAPNWGTFAPGQPSTLYVVDQDGPLWAIDVATGRKTLFFNTRRLLVPLGAC
jgi:hypothetical protein